MSDSVKLCETLGTIPCQAPLSMGFSRQEYWSGLPFPPPGDLPNPETKLASLMPPALAGGFFTSGATWEALYLQYSVKLLKGEHICMCEMGRLLTY